MLNSSSTLDLHRPQNMATRTHGGPETTLAVERAEVLLCGFWSGPGSFLESGLREDVGEGHVASKQLRSARVQPVAGVLSRTCARHVLRNRRLCHLLRA